MELWIRSQNKRNLMETKDIVVVDNYIEIFKQNDDSTRVGEYKTKERALEVLDEIEGLLLLKQGLKLTTNAIYSVDNGLAIYEMPKD